MISSIDDPLQVALQTAQVLSQVIEGWDPEQIQLAQVLHECIQVFETLLSAISCPSRTLNELDPSSGSMKRQQLDSEELKEIKGILEDLLLGKHKGDLKLLSGKLSSKIKLCVSKAHDNVDSALEAIQNLNRSISR